MKILFAFQNLEKWKRARDASVFVTLIFLIREPSVTFLIGIKCLKSHICHYLESCSICGNKICGHCIEEETDGIIKCYGCYWWASCDRCDETVHRYDDSHKDECEWIIVDNL